MTDLTDQELVNEADRWLDEVVDGVGGELTDVVLRAEIIDRIVHSWKCTGRACLELTDKREP